MADARPYALRDLPLPAKFVITAFLLAVGVGYFSALVQLHLQHGSRDGEPLPTVNDVVERFSGLKPFDGKMPKSKLELILSGPKDGGFDKNNMTRAFFDKTSGYEKECKERGQELVDTERDNERQLVIAWGNLDPATRKKTFEDNAFPIPAEFIGKPICIDDVDEEKKNLSIATVIEVRCAVCHNEGDKQPALDNYANLEKLATVPQLDVIDGKWIRSAKQTSIEGLTQSTHAHALSFAVLFSLTGFVFAFSSYPLWFRCLLSPIVVVAQVADIACWWLARLEGIGPYFAMAILGTGGVVGLGLSLQILLSLFNLYGWRGKVIPAVLVAIHAGLLGAIVKEAILPALEAEKKAIQQQSETKPVTKAATTPPLPAPAPNIDPAPSDPPPAKEETKPIPDAKD